MLTSQLPVKEWQSLAVSETGSEVSGPTAANGVRQRVARARLPAKATRNTTGRRTNRSESAEGYDAGLGGMEARAWSGMTVSI